MSRNRTGCPAVRVLMFPKDINPQTRIFGGVILSHIDVAAGIAVRQICSHRMVTKIMKEVDFKKPVQVGDILTCWTEITKIGNTSVWTRVYVEVERQGQFIPVTEADVIYVAVDDDDNPRTIKSGLVEGWESKVACEPCADQTKTSAATSDDSPTSPKEKTSKSKTKSRTSAKKGKGKKKDRK